MSDETVRRLIDYAADIWVALKGIAQELDAWNEAPAYGKIFVNGVESMATADTTPIPANDCPAKVQWYDRLDTAIPHEKTDTSWSAEDENGNASPAVTVVPDLGDASDETATVTFSQGQGMFKVVATTAGAGGAPVRAESTMYDIQPGAAAVGVITVEPVS